MLRVDIASISGANIVVTIDIIIHVSVLCYNITNINSITNTTNNTNNTIVTTSKYIWTETGYLSLKTHTIPHQQPNIPPNTNKTLLEITHPTPNICLSI